MPLSGAEHELGAPPLLMLVVGPCASPRDKLPRISPLQLSRKLNSPCCRWDRNTFYSSGPEGCARLLSCIKWHSPCLLLPPPPPLPLMLLVALPHWWCLLAGHKSRIPRLTHFLIVQLPGLPHAGTDGGGAGAAGRCRRHRMREGHTDTITCCVAFIICWLF